MTEELIAGGLVDRVQVRLLPLDLNGLLNNVLGRGQGHLEGLADARLRDRLQHLLRRFEGLVGCLQGLGVIRNDVAP